MSESFCIVIADRNRNVRDFLRREFVADGYQVELARDCRELLGLIQRARAADLVILDLEMPHLDGLEILEQLQQQHPLLPVVIHSFPPENIAHDAVQKAAAFLEKKGNNIDHLKALVLAVLQKCYPQRYPSKTLPGCAGTDPRE